MKTGATSGKLLEIVWKNRLKFDNIVCSDNDPFQAAFKANSRTTENIFVRNSIVQQYKKLKNPYVLYVS